MESLEKEVGQRLGIAPGQVRSTLGLLDDGNTVPFIARYRKEATGGLDEVEIRDIERVVGEIRALEDRRSSIISSIEEQGELTPALLEKLRRAETTSRLEDLYAPYRPRRVTRAVRALEAGLEPLANAIVDDHRELRSMANELLSEDYPTVDDALGGARDIISERISDDAEVRDYVRTTLREHGRLTSKKRRGADPDPTFKTYLEFSSRLDRVKPHQVLAIRRGENEKALSVSITSDEDRMLRGIDRMKNDARIAYNREQISEAIADGYKRLLHPAVERDLRSTLEEEADVHAIGVFALNVRNLLMQPPLGRKAVLGIDPGLRTGCKLAAVDALGNLEGTGQIYVHDRRKAEAPELIAKVIEARGSEIVAIGNGTGSRETEEVVVEALEKVDREVAYIIVDEAGASVYSASDVAREEFPELDVTFRGAVSIARRIQDPLAELVKIDPKSIGVGMYQHDVDQRQLSEKLDAVVEDVVNQVGVDLNRASRPLLAQVAGIGPSLARSVVEHRTDSGPFRTRGDLLEVSGLGAKTFEQCAGFLRISEGSEPLDRTGVHPESYGFARELLRSIGSSVGDDGIGEALKNARSEGVVERLREKHDVGALTASDVIEALERPGRDPREELDAPILRTEALSMEDLREGMKLSGTVRNVVDFGAFVDIGVKQDGLVHVSEMADRYVKDPYAVVAVGDRVDVTVTSIDRKRGRIGLSMKE